MVRPGERDAVLSFLTVRIPLELKKEVQMI